MAPTVTNGDSPAPLGLDEISKPPTGVVLPPKDIRAIVEKTAGYVARNGPVFEDRIREKEKHNPKFSFLSANDAYYPFYTWRLSEVRAGRGTAVSAGRAGEVAPGPEPEKPKGPAEPPEFHFSARMPNISAQDLDVVRLTALFVAKNGQQFRTTLSQRETRNFQFDFLRPTHSLYQFFSRLVDQYTELLRASGMEGSGGKVERERVKELEENVKSRFHVLERAKQRAEWARYQEEQKQKKEEEEEQEKLIYAQIDWHDFVVVESVLFTEADEQTDLPAPTTLSDLQSASLEQKAMMSLQPHNMRIEEAMPTYEDTYYPPYQPTVEQQQSTQASQQHQEVEMHSASDNEDEEEARIRERAEARARAQQAHVEAKGGAGPMKIRSDYVPRAAAQAANRRGVQMALCPNCKQHIPYNELDEHMRSIPLFFCDKDFSRYMEANSYPFSAVELLDPRWKEQRAKADSRYSTTNLSTLDVANNLKRLASQRSDLFDGVTGQPISEEEAARRKKAALSYDGQPESKDAARLQQMQNVNVEEQIRQIHQKYKQ